MSARWLVVTLFHLVPVLPFLQGYVYGGLAAVLFVALPYIKTRKLNAYIAAYAGALEKLPAGERTAAAKAELESLVASRNRWRWLTFPLGSAESAPDLPH